jgi:hypothetical protein
MRERERSVPPSPPLCGQNKVRDLLVRAFKKKERGVLFPFQ